MKKLILILVTFAVFVQACSQTEEEIAAAFPPDTNAQGLDNPLIPALDAMSLMHFKEDFVGYMPVKKALNPTTSPLLFKHGKSLRTQNKMTFTDNYASIKTDMILYRNQDVAYHSPDIQHLALRMLRYYFLPDSAASAIAETQFLLDILIESKAIDLDVLADAYVKVKPVLKAEEQKKYMDYLQQLYWKDRKKIQDKFEDYKKGYETSMGIEKRKFLYKGRHLMVLSQALRYTNDLLKIETEQKN